MKARIGGREVEIDEQRVRGGVGGGAMERDSLAVLRQNSREPVPNPAPAPSFSRPYYRSKLEAFYATHLRTLQYAGEIRTWWYEPFSLRLPGLHNFHRIDFLIQYPDAHLEIHQTKGWHKNLRDGITKAKTAAGIHTWATHVLVRREKGQFIMKRIEP